MSSILHSLRIKMSSVRLEEQHVRGLLSHDVHNAAFLSMLAKYRGLLSSVYGPCGASILVQNAAGQETLVSSSSEIVKQLSFTHPCVKYINAIISAQNTSCSLNGLYAGLLCVRLLEETLKCEEDIPHAVVNSVSEYIVTQLLNHLGKSPVQVVMDLDIGDMSQVISFVKTILKAKSTLSLTPPVIDSLSISIVKAFLKSVPNEYSSEGFGHVSVITRDDSSSLESRVFDGVLYREPDLCPERIAKLKSQRNLKLLLFTVALTFIEEENVSVHWNENGTKEENFVNAVLPCLKMAMKGRGIHILANQKPVDPVIKYELERNGWMVLERLGSRVTEAVERISFCQPVTTLMHLSQQLATITLGNLTSVDHVVCNGKSYILLDHCEGSVSSLLLPSASPSVISTLKETVESCLAALRMVVVDGKVVAGGGCLEAWASSYLSDHLTRTATFPPGATPHHLIKVGSAFVRVLMELALLPSGGLMTKLDWSVDSVFHHLWHTPPNIVRETGKTDNSSSIPKHCVCGLVQWDAVKHRHGGKLQLVEMKINPVQFSQGRQKKSKLCKLTGADRCNADSEESCASRSGGGLRGRCMEEDSLEGSQTTSEEEVDSLEKVISHQEGEIDSLEGKLDSFDDDDDDDDSLEGLLDRVVESNSRMEDPTHEARLEGHVSEALYDSFPAKFNAVRLALESFSQLLHIGHCVFDQ